LIHRHLYFELNNTIEAAADDDEEVIIKDKMVKHTSLVLSNPSYHLLTENIKRGNQGIII
jgi:hypothetical protein